MAPLMPPVYEDECLSVMPPYMPLSTLSPSCSIIDPTIGPYLPSNLNAALATENLGLSVMKINRFVNGARNSTPLASEISSMEDPTFRVHKLTIEERREKIHRNIVKSFRYQEIFLCEHNSNSGPHVRGRFAKNDELEMNRTGSSSSNQEEDIDEDVRLILRF
ncbi:hypothetical protein ACH5RR_006438 [Cinchona calisaya]|uniref:Uncharacterized protein n=1 Tax=Cinchona calisaya TaxID=153742 RepID=A0ABD3APA4_9GENT